MSENQTWITTEEFKRVLENPHLLIPGIRTLKSQEHRVSPRHRGRLDNAEYEVTLAGAQELLDRGKLKLRPEPDEPSEQSPSPAAFLEKYGLKPGKASAS